MSSFLAETLPFSRKAPLRRWLLAKMASAALIRPVREQNGPKLVTLDSAVTANAGQRLVRDRFVLNISIRCLVYQNVGRRLCKHARSLRLLQQHGASAAPAHAVSE